MFLSKSDCSLISLFHLCTPFLYLLILRLLAFYPIPTVLYLTPPFLLHLNKITFLFSYKALVFYLFLMYQSAVSVLIKYFHFLLSSLLCLLTHFDNAVPYHKQFSVLFLFVQLLSVAFEIIQLPLYI